MTPRELEEFRSLRATIQQRGTARVWVFAFGLAAWAALLTAVWSAGPPIWAVLAPLVELAGVFEAVFALHVGAERIGRYVQVFLEGDAPGWEHRIMRLGGAGAMKPGGDALFSPIFIAATFVNFSPAAISAAGPGELLIVAGLHVALVGRILDARRRAAGQRALDLEAFRKLS